LWDDQRRGEGDGKGELRGKEHAVDIGRLGEIDRARFGGELEDREGGGGIWRKTQLTEKMRHSHALA
jgi:hypothetical protein